MAREEKGAIKIDQRKLLAVRSYDIGILQIAMDDGFRGIDIDQAGYGVRERQT